MIIQPANFRKRFHLDIHQKLPQFKPRHFHELFRFQPGEVAVVYDVLVVAVVESHVVEDLVLVTHLGAEGDVGEGDAAGVDVVDPGADLVVEVLDHALDGVEEGHQGENEAEKELQNVSHFRKFSTYFLKENPYPQKSP